MKDFTENLYGIIVFALAVYFVVGGIAWGVMAWNGKAVPDGLATTIATTGGGLIGTLSPRAKKEE